MPRQGSRLSAIAVAKTTTPGRYGDGHGLWLQVSPAGTKAWLFRYQRNGKAHQMGLGPVHTVSLAKARERARECRQKLLDGLDPLEERRTERQNARAASARGITFAEAAERMIAAHESGWRNAKHRAQWRATLDTYAGPVMGRLDVAAIDTAMVVKVLSPIWTTKPETASRLRGRIEAVLDWARVGGFRSGENPARWRGHLDKLLPARSKLARVRHHPAMPYDELPAFMSDLRARDSISARALELAILTAARTGEAIGATWAEIDLHAKLWTIPSARMKAGREHRVPLSDRAVEILERLPRETGNPFVFIGGRAGRPLSNMALLQLLRGMRPGFVPHGFRSSFRDWAAERTGYPSEVVEMALAHTVGSKVEAAYRRGDLFEKRRRLTEDWAQFCGAPAASAEVFPMARRS